MKDQEFIVRRIRSQYTETGNTELDALKTLDIKAKKPANVFGYTYGSVGALVMGAGMSLVMTDIGTVLGLDPAMVPGIILGVLGMGMMLTTRPIHKRILASGKQKYRKQILFLSEKLMKE